MRWARRDGQQSLHAEGDERVGAELGGRAEEHGDSVDEGVPQRTSGFA